MSKPLDVLLALLSDAGLEPTLSVCCRSGVVGDLCRCWRCRGESGPVVEGPDILREVEMVDRAIQFGRAQQRQIHAAAAAVPDAGREIHAAGNDDDLRDRLASMKRSANEHMGRAEHWHRQALAERCRAEDAEERLADLAARVRAATESLRKGVGGALPEEVRWLELAVEDFERGLDPAEAAG